MAVVAERAFTSRSTLQRVEAGDTNVSIGIYAGVLQALGLLNGLSQIADIANDSVGQTLGDRRSAQARAPQAAGEDVARWLTSRSISILAATRAPSDWREAIGSAVRRRFLFEYDAAWLRRPGPVLPGAGSGSHPWRLCSSPGLATFGSIGDSAPDILGATPHAALRAASR